MWRLINFSLVLLCLFGRVSFAENACSEKDPLNFRDDVSIMPVQFVDYNDGHLTALFASKTMLEKMEFLLAPDLKNSFYEVNGEWMEEISRKTFLKKFKKDYWMVTYATQEGKNVFCSASQFKNWEFLRANYGQSSDSLLKTIDAVAYWRAMKMRPLTFHAVEEEKGYWLFLAATNEPIPEEKELVELENQSVIPTILKSLDNVNLELIDHGVFTIAKNCTFQILETKGPKRVKVPLTNAGINLSRPKARLKAVDRAYFVENIKKSFWFCFFDQDAKVLLRAVQVPDDSKEDAANKNDKEIKEKDGKNLK